jgi:hypothetical protein
VAGMSMLKKAEEIADGAGTDNFRLSKLFRVMNNF